MAAEGIWQNITALFSGLMIHGDSKISSGLSSSLTFEGFSRLPEKVRIKIWIYSLPGPRLVRMVGYLGSERILSSALSHPFHLLHVNRESRKVALTKYCVLRDLSVVPVYIDPKIDLLCFLDFDQFRNFIRERVHKVHKGPPVIDKFVVFGIAETKELDARDRIEDVMDASYSARFIYPDLKKVIFVLEKDQVEKQLAQTLENKEKKRKIYEVLKGKFGDRIPLDLQVDFLTMESLVLQYNVETDSELGA
ncbi:48e312e0-88c6-4a20-9946-fc96adaa9a0a-CDS [Sclerotinia trifoliorum]|uniref:48e312e0-88c6-4a20-9946-fc96adaa9a0a-CDS n=1 Tax=Sclerotinia trifoliorum TaxID=28548 RepID=A0A8H2ZQS9_9HELO|nr:48e312e0-88c6-4a20-9946-fc96adaa9a0a-CDS [Sclerotinia trifoliorum]